MKNNARRYAEIILSSAEKAGVYNVKLAAQGDAADQVIINTIAECPRKRCVRIRYAPTFVRLVRRSQQEFSKGTVAADRHGDTRAEQECVAAGIQPECGTRRKNALSVVPAIIPAQIANDPQPRQKFAFDRSFPSVHAGIATTCQYRAAVRERLSVQIRVAEEGVAFGWQLRVGKARKYECDKGDRADLL